MKSAYSKPKVLEHIFNQKYNANNPQPEIPFTRDEVRDAITATGGKIPFNPNNFVKDLTRKGDSDPRSPSAKQAGYFLREGTHSGSMGIFFQDSGPFAGVISISCPPDLAAKPIRTKISPDILDLLRPDERRPISRYRVWRSSRRLFWRSPRNDNACPSSSKSSAS